MDEILAELIEAVVPLIKPLVTAAALVLLTWLGKKAALIRGAKSAALAAEETDKAAAEKKAHARKLLSQTMAGRLTTLHNIDQAIEDHGMRAVKEKRNSSRPPKD